MFFLRLVKSPVRLWSFIFPLLSAFTLFLNGIDSLEEIGNNRPNILFIAVDDLRPALGSYGVDDVISPNLDSLASRGTVFKRAYSQQAICNPSRASLMTGLRPDSTGVYDLTTHFRIKVPGVVTLPQHFKEHGYHTQSMGKVYHPAFHGAAIGSDLLDDPSWSVPVWMGEPRYYFSPLGKKLTREVYAKKTGKTGKDLENWKTQFLRSLATEAPDVPDNMLYDGELTDRSIKALQGLSKQSKPFFLAVGYLKPHLPFIAPKKYWDLYDPMNLTLPENQATPKGVPKIAMAVEMRELRDSYPFDVKVDPETGLPVDEWSTYKVPDKGPIPTEQKRRLLHGYYACISFIDAQIGRLLNELDRLGLADNTVVLVYGDHGFHLGEHGIWGKLTNFEVATHSPLIVSSPYAKAPGVPTEALVELVDIYPSLCDLAGLPLPSHLEGYSFAALMDKPDLQGKEAAFSQYPRGDIMGYSMRTDRYRFNFWPAGDATGQEARYELYDHKNDPNETVNLAVVPQYKSLISEFKNKLLSSWETIHN